MGCDATTTVAPTTTEPEVDKWYPNLPNESAYCSQGPKCSTEPAIQQGDICYYNWLPSSSLYDSELACCENEGCEGWKWYPNFPNSKEFCSFGPKCTTESNEDRGNTCYLSWQSEFFESEVECCEKYGCEVEGGTETTVVATTEGSVTTEGPESTVVASTEGPETTEGPGSTSSSVIATTESPETTVTATTESPETTEGPESTVVATTSSSVIASTEVPETTVVATTEGPETTVVATTSSSIIATTEVPETTVVATTEGPESTVVATTSSSVIVSTDAPETTESPETSSTTTTTTATTTTTTTTTTTSDASRPAKWYMHQEEDICIYGDDYPAEFWDNLTFRSTVLFDERQACCDAYGGNACDTLSPTVKVTSAPTVRSPDNCYPNARFVKILSTTGKPIQVFEVEVLSSNVNVAVGASASHSATLGNRNADKAIDGNYNSYSHTTDDTEGDGSEWLEIDLGGIKSIDSIVVHNRWCLNADDPNGCLCRLSEAVLSLTDENGNSIATSSYGDTCGKATVEVDYEPNCPSPTTRPTKLPTLPPVHPRKWFPDQTPDVNDCIFGNEYPDWMSGGPNAEEYLYETEDECCHHHQCDSYYIEMWYPEIVGDHIKCLFGTDYSVAFKREPEGYLFETEDECCEEYGCAYKYTSSPATASPSKAPVTAEPTSASPTQSPITAEPTSASPTSASPTMSPVKITLAPTSAAPTHAPTERKPDECYPNARFVKLESTTTNPIQIFELEILSDGDNVASDATALHSDTFRGNDASNAIDGDYDTYSHTNNDPDGAKWLEIDLGEEHSIDTFVVHNRWCADNTDPYGCLCRLTGALLILRDDNGNNIASAKMPDTCSHDTITVSYMPHCPAPTQSPTTLSPTQAPTTLAPSASPITSPPSKAPTIAPTKKPVTSSPTEDHPNLEDSKPEYWYPDIDTPGNDCVFGPDYKPWMALAHWHPHYLFGSKNACCCAHNCDDMQCTQQAPPNDAVTTPPFNPDIDLS